VSKTTEYDIALNCVHVYKYEYYQTAPTTQLGFCTHRLTALGANEKMLVGRNLSLILQTEI